MNNLVTIPRDANALVTLSDGQRYPVAHPIAVKANAIARFAPAVARALHADHDSDWNVTRYCVEGRPAADECRAALAIIDAETKPAAPAKIVKWLTELKFKTRSRTESTDDVEAQLALYARELRSWPANIVEHVLRELGDSSPWWPAWADLLAALRRWSDLLKMRAALETYLDKLPALERQDREAAERIQHEKQAAQEHFDRMYATVRDAFGADAPAPEEVAAAIAFARGCAGGKDTRFILSNLSIDLEKRRPWAAELCKRLAKISKLPPGGQRFDLTAAAAATAYTAWEREYDDRDEFQLAHHELIESGATVDEITAFLVAVADGDQAAIARQSELATAQRARGPLVDRLPRSAGASRHAAL